MNKKRPKVIKKYLQYLIYFKGFLTIVLYPSHSPQVNLNIKIHPIKPKNDTPIKFIKNDQFDNFEYKSYYHKSNTYLS